MSENGHVPSHIAIIMDGNGRWARRRGLLRILGHKEGVESVREITRECAKKNGTNANYGMHGANGRAHGVREFWHRIPLLPSLPYFSSFPFFSSVTGLAPHKSHNLLRTLQMRVLAQLPFPRGAAHCLSLSRVLQ